MGLTMGSMLPITPIRGSVSPLTLSVSPHDPYPWIRIMGTRGMVRNPFIQAKTCPRTTSNRPILGYFGTHKCMDLTTLDGLLQMPRYARRTIALLTLSV